MEQIRVLQVLSGLDRGGIENMVMNLYRAIDKTKIQFDFIIHRHTEDAFCDEVRALGGNIYLFPKFSLLKIGSYKKFWKNFLKDHPEYKVIHSHVRSYAIVFIRIAKKLGRKTIVHSHSTSNGSGIGSLVKMFMQLPLRRESDYLFACSEISGRWLFGDKAIKKDNYKMIKNAIDTNRYVVSSEVRQSYRKSFNAEDKVVYGHVGRLSEPKNHSFLLDIFKEIVSREPNSLLVIVGAGEYQAQIGAKIKQLSLENSVVMTGARADIPELLSAMDVFLFPSLWEGLPVTVVEAQAAGLPCLVSDTVTSEVAVSEAVEYLPIDKGTSVWVEKALSAAGKRYSVVDKIKLAGFDTATTCEELTSFYRSLSNE